MRLTGTSLDCFKYLEPLLNDYRKVRVQDREGKFHLSHMDEFVDRLLREERVSDIQLPRLQKRHVLEENNELEPRVSLLEADDFDLDDEDEDDDFEEKKKIAEMLDKAKQSSSKDDRRERSRRSRSRSRDRERKRRRSRSRSRGRKKRSRSRDRSERKKDRKPKDRENRDKDREYRDKDRDKERGSKGGSKDSMSVEETNKMRAELGLPPLK